MHNQEELERHVEKESPINKVVAIMVAIISAALLIWAGYHIYMTVSAEKRHGVTRSPETVEQLDRSRELLEKEKRDKEELESAQSLTRQREAAERQEQIRFSH
jgi:uncharacterized protein (DUF3084 family)